ILEVLYGAGVRVSELTGLNLEDLDLERGYIRVYGKGSKERISFLGEKGC
ncbi:MAG TPA: site-specific tyrosine recombinase XerD, partial [Firmicutes bacterium]|nr:site-specific tyrosine recombinase XerD [Bacillota bacterium]